MDLESLTKQRHELAIKRRELSDQIRDLDSKVLEERRRQEGSTDPKPGDYLVTFSNGVCAVARQSGDWWKIGSGGRWHSCFCREPEISARAARRVLGIPSSVHLVRVERVETPLAPIPAAEIPAYRELSAMVREKALKEIDEILRSLP